MTLSPKHKELPISSIDKRILPAIFLKQFRLFAKGKQLVAFLTWAKVSDEIKAEIEAKFLKSMGRVKDLFVSNYIELVEMHCFFDHGPSK